MSGRSGVRSTGRPTDEPELTRLDRPGPGAGWRVGAVVVAMLLVGIVVAGRLGMQETALEPSASPTTAALVSPSAGTPVPSDSADAPPTSPPADPPPPPTGRPPVGDPVPDVARHLDGIPTSIGGEKVYRVASAIRRVPGSDILVGGWHLNPVCIPVERCPLGVLAETPALGSLPGDVVPLIADIDRSGGPAVVRGLLTERCFGAGCALTLEASDVVWMGDFFTRTAPIEAHSLLGALDAAFPDMDPEPFRDLSRCTLPWPPQTYRSTTGGPRMTLVFPTVADRRSVEERIVDNWPRPSADLVGQCLDQFMSAPDEAGWLVRENVMLWLSDADDGRALAEAALTDALGQSEAAPMPATDPLTTWGALRGLRGWEPALEILPPHDVHVSGPGISFPNGVPEPVAAYALSDPFVRVLVVFARPAERRAYEASVDPTALSVTGAARHHDGALGLELYEWGRERPRWLGHANVLLQLGGPHRFDERLLEALRSVN